MLNDNNLFERLMLWVSSLMPAGDDFFRGFYTALYMLLASLLLVVLLCIIVKLIFRKPAVSGVTLPRDDGDIFISRNAIVDLIFRLESDYSHFEFLKAVLKRNRKGLALSVVLNFDESGSSSFPVCAEALKQRIFADLKNILGIEEIASVEIRLNRPCKASDKDNNDLNGSIRNSIDPTAGNFVAGL